MQGTSLNGNFREYYLSLQKEWKFKYLPGDEVKINTNLGPMTGRILDVYKVSDIPRYNGIFIDDGDGCFKDILTSDIDNDLMINVSLGKEEIY